MKFKDLAKQVRLQVGADEYTLSNDDLATLYNAEVENYAHFAVLANVNEHWLGGVRELTVTDGSVEIPSEVIRINRIEAFISWEWKILQLYNLNRVPTLADADFLSVYMENRKAGFAIFGRTLYVLASEDIETIRLYAQMYPDYIEADIFETEHTLEKPWNKAGLPRIWHRLLKNRMAIAWKESRDKPIPLTGGEQQMAGDIQTAMRVAGVVSTSRIYKFWKRKLEDVYEVEQYYNPTSNTEALLTDTTGIFLMI